MVDMEPATFSPDRIYRYRLERCWSSGPRVGFILLNPSTADETNNDPTIRRCINYAKRWGYGGMVLGNIFALRSTDPNVLYTNPAPIGPENDAWLGRIAAEVGGDVVCGWGAHGAWMGRGKAVLKSLLDAGYRPRHWTLTASGEPGHPLYLKATMVPQAWW